MLKFLIPALVLSAFAFSSCGGGGDDDDAPGGKDSRAAQATPTSAELEALTRVSVDGYDASGARVIPVGATVTYTSTAKTAGGAQVVVLATFSACTDLRCMSLDEKQYESADAQANLKSVISAAHAANPALIWEYGEVQLSGTATGLSTYAASYLETKAADGTTRRTEANLYRAWYHNGGTLVAFDVTSRGGDSVRSVDDVKKQMSKADAEKAAKDVFAAIEPSLKVK